MTEQNAQLEGEKKPHCGRWEVQRCNLGEKRIASKGREPWPKREVSEREECMGIEQGKHFPKGTDWENKRG